MSVRCDGAAWSTPAAAAWRGSSPSRAASSTRGSPDAVARSPGSTRRAQALLRTSEDGDLTTLRRVPGARGVQRHFRRSLRRPVVSCVWSAGRETHAGYPARYLFRFLDHHGLLRVAGSLSVHGRRRVNGPTSSGWPGSYRTSARPRRPGRDQRADGVEIRDVTGQVTRVDGVVIADARRPALSLLA